MSTLLIVHIISVLTIGVLYFIYNYIRADLSNNDWQLELSNSVLDWCIDLYPVRKPRPKLKFLNSRSMNAGEYYYATNTICIYRKYNVIPEDLIDTVIHEYFHYMNLTSYSKVLLYDKQNLRFGLHNHPQEILCVTMAKELTKRYLRKK